MKKIRILLVLTLTMFMLGSFAQGVGINNDESNPDPSAILDVKSTNQGMLVPRMSVIEAYAISNPAEGLLIYATDVQSFLYFKGGNWNYLTSEFSYELADVDFDTKITTGNGLDPDDDLIKIYCGKTGESFIIDSLRIAPQSKSIFIGRKAGGQFPDGDNIAIGDSALFNNGIGASSSVDAQYNTAVGNKSLFSNEIGFFNTAIGTNALFSNTTGALNTAIGTYALFANTSSDNNTAIGSGALSENSSGEGNTALGVNTLGENNSGYFNTAIGLASLNFNTTGSSNVAVGVEAGHTNTTGSNNTAIGYQSLFSNDNGLRNTAVGMVAGSSNISGFYNTIVGAYANTNAGNFSNSAAIGDAALITAGSQIRLGDAGVNSIGGYANWTNISDKRFKTNVKKDVPGLEFIQLLEPVTYNLNVTAINEFLGIDNSEKAEVLAESGKENMKMTGFLAQEVEDAARSVNYEFSGVDAPKNDKDTYGLRYAEFVVPLVKAVQELAEENRLLKERIEKLENK
ncbi:MAG: tail fiber domain-containing protein [Bacteroidetes bacterium]|nr:tail fiber domain-containing protein [Bacteroidota bacterium]